MILRTQSVPMTEGMREIGPSQDQEFPYSALEADLNLFAGRCSPWHWHSCFEFATVERSSIELQTPNFHAILREGDAYFVNANMLHLCKACDGGESVRLHVHQFERGILPHSSLIVRHYIAPIEDATALEAAILRFDRPADREIITALTHAFNAAETEPAGFEMAVCAHLLDAWQKLYHLVTPQLGARSDDAREDILRAKTMLRFIHTHYDQPITVEQIGSAAGICERECFRCFARIMDTSPKAYLTQYRIGVAARLLTESNLSITQIAYQCGFSNSSYFGKVFHQLLGCSPRAYRAN